MNAKFLLASIATATLLTACGGDHAHIKAVDKVAEAEALAKEKAPKAEPVSFEDEGKPTIGGVGGTKGTTPAPTETAPASDTTAQADAQADTAEAKTEEPKPAETKEEAKPAEGEATAETPAQAEQPAEQPAEATAEAKPEGEATATAEAPAETKTN